jgi:hypothetical protein
VSVQTAAIRSSTVESSQSRSADGASPGFTRRVYVMLFRIAGSTDEV